MCEKIEIFLNIYHSLNFEILLKTDKFHVNFSEIVMKMSMEFMEITAMLNLQKESSKSIVFESKPI